MNFLQSGPAETTGYLILGYAIIFGVIVLHLASFEIRKRNLKADMEMLKPRRSQQKTARKKPKRK